MIYIKNKEHGFLAVPYVSEVQRMNGWKECDIYKEISKKKDEEETPEKIFEKRIESMTKIELEEYARTLGIELDRRNTKENMLKDLEDKLNDSR